ncbi:unnamed protein product [Anisakis simplex]|uniref:Uncharacterized protein n=1 Tax=Anisakis simplex TaxID=6269 RepID=A0A0M3JU27_ANISI|nr:unnamed protein product [Anisakis simplex]
MEVVLPEAVPEVEPAQEDASQILEETETAQAVADREPTSDVPEAVEVEIEKEQEDISSKEEHKEVEEHFTEQAEEPSPPIAQEVTTDETAPMDSTTVESGVDTKSDEKIETYEPLREAFTPVKKESRQETSEPVNLIPDRLPSPTQSCTRSERLKAMVQDSFRLKGAPPRLPTNASFSSYTPVARSTYSSLSPWVQSAANKYRTDYSTKPTYTPTSPYLSQFDDMVKTGAFSNNLYSVNRLLERSRSRTRERKNASRSARSASNYNRYTSTYGAAPIRTREYSTPPTSAIRRVPSRSSSFISFMQYSDAKNYEMARSRSRSYGFDFPLSRSTSRANIEPYYETGRLSRVDSYVQNMNSQYEWTVPSTYATYRSSSRSNLFQRNTPLDGYPVHSFLSMRFIKIP